MKNEKFEQRTKDLMIAVMTKKNEKIGDVFHKFAKKWDIGENSVRNLYYSELNRLTYDADYRTRIGINISQLQKTNFVFFEEGEKVELLINILSSVEKGESVRSVCMRLADNDINLMIRLQNKYRAMLKNERAFVEKIVQANDLKSPFVKLPNNVISISDAKSSSILSEKEITGLFNGLVRLIRNNSINEISSALTSENKLKTLKLRKVSNELEKTREALIEEQRKNRRLCKFAELAINNQKTKEFEVFLKKFVSNETGEKP